MAWEIDPKKRRIWSVVVGLTALNIGTLVAGVCWLGGDAFSGKIEDEVYYLGDHGRFTKVDRVEWIYSFTHCVLFTANWFVALIVGLWALKRRS